MSKNLNSLCFMFTLTVCYVHCPLVSVISIRNHNILAKTKNLAFHVKYLWKNDSPKGQHVSL